jgi:hypothetical protein
MAFFITERQVEHHLEEIVRDMPLPGGDAVPVRNFRINWEAQDFLDEFTDITEEEICRITELHAQESGKPYQEAYFDIIAHLQVECRKQLGIDES